MDASTKPKWLKVIEVGMPAILTVASPIPSIYTAITEPRIHFVYETQYEANRIEKARKDAAEAVLAASVFGTQVFNNKKEARTALQEFNAKQWRDLGYRDAEAFTVKVFNVGSQELKNIKAHFIGCQKYVSSETFPDSTQNGPGPVQGSDNATLKYEKLPISKVTVSEADITFYGESTVNCVPQVQAEFADGREANGEKVTSIQVFLAQTAGERAQAARQSDIAFKVLVCCAIVLIYLQLIAQNRKLRQVRDTTGKANLPK